MSRGDVEGALELQEERLKINEELGDLDEIANTLWSLASIEKDREAYQQAFEYLATSYRIIRKIGRLDGIAYVGLDLGLLLCQAGKADQGIPILQRSLEGFRHLGQEAMAGHVQAIIAHFAPKETPPGDLDSGELKGPAS